MARAVTGTGPYTHLPPRDRETERAWVRREVTAIQYPDSDDVTTLDGQITGKRVQWESAVDDAYTQRKQRLAVIIRQAESELGPSNRVVREARHQVKVAEAQRTALEERLQGSSPTPGQAVQRVGEVDPVPSRSFDEGGLPPHYAGTGFSWGSAAYGIALLIAAAADVAGFYQVLALLLGSWPWILIVIVVTCAVGSLFLMHWSGVEFKRFREQGRLWVSMLTITTWAVLGAGAFTVRFTTEENAGATSGAFAVLTGPSSFAAEEAWVKATVFLVVYIASGVLALVGGYATYDRVRKQYAKATSAVAKASRRLTRVEKNRNRIVATIEQAQDELEQERERWANARKEREAFAAELVALVAIEIRKRVDDPDERSRIDVVHTERLTRMKLVDLEANRRTAVQSDAEKPPPIRTPEQLWAVGFAS